MPDARGVEARVAGVRSLLRAADAVYARRDALAPALVASTGLSPEGVALGFESLEREAPWDPACENATDANLRALVAAAGDARHVHVVLSANVFVAAVRALALAVAAAPRVTLRPSPRDPVVARALVDAVAERTGADHAPRIAITEERDVAAVVAGGADVVHVYGRDETIAEVRARCGAWTFADAPISAGPRATVVGHGAGMGVAWIGIARAHAQTRDAALRGSAASLARDVVTFDQRGCLSPRIALVEGDAARAHEFAAALHEHLADFDARVPRGALAAAERAAATRWQDALSFAGRAWAGDGHVVGVVDRPVLALPPPGRHVHVVAVADAAAARAILAPMASAIVAVGSNDPAAATAIAPGSARISELGRMQRPALDGPVDRRTAGVAIGVT